MAWGRVVETDLMPRLVVGYTELGCGKLKKGNGFLEPNHEPLPNRSSKLIAEFHSIISHRPVHMWK